MSDIEIEVETIGRTEKAVWVTDGKVKAWVPRSQISDYCGDEDNMTSIFIPEGIALEKGLL